MPQQPDIEEAGATLESLEAEWLGAPKRIQQSMLREILKAVIVDVLGQRLVCVKPYPQFASLLRMDGMEEKSDGHFCYEEEGTEA